MNIGIRGTPLKLFSSYISNRQQMVCCNGQSSKLCKLQKGVPQGSILGPILFLICINDITRASSTMNFTLFADDTNLLMANENINILHHSLTKELDCVVKWLTCNRLTLNIQKICYIFFQSHSLNNSIPPLCINNQPITEVSHTKFLGVHIDRNLNWKHHISSVCDKLSKLCGIMYKIRKMITKEALISIYYTLCYPHIMQCLPTWGCTWPSYLQKVLIAQKKILRCLLYLGKYDSVESEFSNLGLLKFCNIHKYFVVLFLHKNLFLYNNTTFRFIDHHNHNTRRNNVNLVCPEFRTTLVKNSIIYSGPKLWNSLSNDLKTMAFSSNINVFKGKLKKHIIQQQNQSIQSTVSSLK